MQRITQIIERLAAIQFVDIIVAIAIMILFYVLSGSIAYVVIKLFKMKVKKGRAIRKSSLYNPLRYFICVLGVYIAVCVLRYPLNIGSAKMELIDKTFFIISIIVFAKGLAKSFTPGSSLVYELLEKTEKKEVDSSVAFLLKAVRFVIYAIAVFLIITELGVDLSGLIAGFGITGVIITLAAQDTAKNLFGGLVIFLDKPFVVGDWIEFDTHEGTVEDITFRSTRIRTFENSVVNVPNSLLSNTSINNWSRMEKRRFKCILCIELNTPLEKVQILTEKIKEMLINRDGIIDDSVMVKFESISDNGINLLVYSYTNSVDYATYLEETEKINYRILKILSNENVELAYDTKTVYLKQ